MNIQFIIKNEFSIYNETKEGYVFKIKYDWLKYEKQLFFFYALHGMLQWLVNAITNLYIA